MPGQWIMYRESIAMEMCDASERGKVRLRRCDPVEFTYFSEAAFAILHDTAVL
jgi:hypothetical protein